MSKRNLILILIAATLLAYFSSFGNPFIWDDEQFITSNQYVQNFDIGKIFTTNTVAGAGVQSNYYRPLTTLSFAIDSKLWSFGSAQDKGLNVFGFHVTNLLFHIGAGIFLFLFLLELFNMAKPGAGLYPAFFIALFFLVHPIQVEAVTYINSRGDSMYAFFLFASLWLFTKSLFLSLSRPLSFPRRRESIQMGNGSRVFARDDKRRGARDDKRRETRDDNKKVWILYISVVVTFICSLLSKEIALAGVGLYPIIYVFSILSSRAQSEISNTRIENRGSGIKNEISHPERVEWVRNDKENTKYIFFVIGVIWVITALYLLLRLTVLDFGNTLNFYQGVQNEYTRSLAIRLFTFCKVIWIYLGLLVWPYPLHMERSIDLVKSFWSPWVLGMLGLVGGLGLPSIVYAFRRWQAGELDESKSYEVRPHQQTSLILLGMSWFFIMLVPASGIIPINGILYEHWLYVPSIGFWIMTYGVLLWVFSLCKAAHLKSQNSKVKNTSKILHILYLRCRFAVCDLIFAIKNKLLIPFVTLLAVLYVVLTIRQNNIWADPVGFYTYTLQFAPNSARLHNNLGMTLATSGNAKDAIPEYKKALALGPGYPQVYNNLGNAELTVGEYKDAEKNLKKALILSPNFQVARLNLIKLYLVTKQWGKAESLAAQNPQLLQEVKSLENR